MGRANCSGDTTCNVNVATEKNDTKGSILKQTQKPQEMTNRRNASSSPDRTFRPLCETSGKCLAVDIADRPKKRIYPGLLTAKVNDRKINKLNVQQLRKKHLRIRNIYDFLDGCGFFTFPLVVMNQLLVAKRYGLIGDDMKPIVYLPENHHYFDNSTSCGNGGGSLSLSLVNEDESTSCSDFWEKWFEPVADLRWTDVKEEVDVWEFTQNSIKTIYYDTNSIHAYPYHSGEKGTADWIAVQRERAKHVMEEFIRVRHEIKQESFTLFEQHFGSTKKGRKGKTMGVHMRGTDKFVTPKVDIYKYDFHVDKFLMHNQDEATIFLATDDPSYLDHMQKRYGQRVTYLNAIRMDKNVLYDKNADKTAKSKEALMDMLMLSLGNNIVKGWSGVSEFAVYFRQQFVDNNEMMSNFEIIVDLQLEVTKENEFEQNSYYKDIELDRTSYLPDTLSKDSVRDGEINEKDFNRVAMAIDMLASDDCHDNRTIELSLVEFGFGASINSLLKPLMHSLNHGYCLKDPKGWNKFNCTGWNDLFLPLSTKKQFSSDSQQVFEKRNETYQSRKCTELFNLKTKYTRIGLPKLFMVEVYRKCMEEYSYGKVGYNMLPISYHDVGLFQYVSAILHYIMRPSNALSERIMIEKEKMGWPTTKDKPILGIHFRAGDACLEDEDALGRKCDSFDKYMKVADTLQLRYNIQHIYIATDSDNLLDSLVDKYPNWHFHFIKDMDRGGLRNSKGVDILLKQGGIDGCTEAKNSLIDMLLLGECDAFIGKFSSNIDRIAYSLMYARDRRHRPHVSLDNSWCFDFGVESRPGVDKGSGKLFYC